MTISMEQVKELREKTGISIMQCRKALEEAGGDMEKAVILLQKKGAEAAAKKSDRVSNAGRVISYVHGTGSVGVLVELASESDFVSKNDDFAKLGHEIAMQIAATSPLYIKKDDVPLEERNKVLEAILPEVEGKPEAMREKILAGKLDAFFKERILLEQEYIKDPAMTVAGFLEGAIQKFGEKIEIIRFVRFGANQ